MSLPAGRFGRSDRLLHSRDFQRVARSGTRVASRHFVLLVAPARVTPEASTGREASGRSPQRLGVTASRKVGRAIARNRVKRGIREWFRGCRDEFGPDVDIVVIARRDAAALGTVEIRDDLKALMSRMEQPGGRRHHRRGRIEEERG